LHGEFELFLHGTAKEMGDRLVFIQFDIRQVDMAEPIHYTLNAVGSVTRGSEQRHKVAAGRATPYADMLGIDIILRGMVAQKVERSAAVINLRWEWCFAAQLIVEAGGGKALRR